MTRRTRGKKKDRSAAPESHEGPRHTKRRRGPSVTDVILGVIVAAGAVYLLWPTSRPSWPDEAMSVVPRDLSVSLAPPQPAYEGTADGMRVGHLDLDRLGAWCSARGLPPPPALPTCEPAVAEALTRALTAVSAARTAATLGTMGQVSESLDCHQSAEWYFQQAQDADPRDFRWPYYLGCVYQLTGRSDDALRQFHRVLELNAEYGMTHARLGHLHLESGDDESAENSFALYAEAVPRDSLGDIGLGRVALRRKDFAGALTHLQRAIRKTPSDFQAHYYLARAYAGLGERDRAKQHFDRSEKLPRGKWFKMRDPLDQAMHRVTGSTNSLITEFEQLQHSRDWTRLTGLAERIIEGRPSDTTMLGNLASLYRKQKRFDDAHASLDRALAQSPESNRLRTIRAEVLLAQSRLDEAIEIARTVVKVESNSAAAFTVLGRARYLQNRFAEAEPALRRAVELAPNDIGNAYVLAETLLRLGRREEAVTWYRKILDADPGFEPASRRMAELTQP